jgi:hypothetical protein
VLQRSVLCNEVLVGLAQGLVCSSGGCSHASASGCVGGWVGGCGFFCCCWWCRSSRCWWCGGSRCAGPRPQPGAGPGGGACCCQERARAAAVGGPPSWPGTHEPLPMQAGARQPSQPPQGLGGGRRCPEARQHPVGRQLVASRRGASAGAHSRPACAAASGARSPDWTACGGASSPRGRPAGSEAGRRWQRGAVGGGPTVCSAPAHPAQAVSLYLPESGCRLLAARSAGKARSPQPGQASPSLQHIARRLSGQFPGSAAARHSARSSGRAAPHHVAA